MTDIINKITSYNLFNYLLPGILFAVIADYLTSYRFILDNLIIGVFVYYFIGLVISRFGSLILEPLLKKITFIKFVEYKSYVNASKVDPKLETLSEANNMYRTYIAMLTLLITLKLYELVELKFQVLKTWSPYILICFLLLMFLYSYRKQTNYITKRIHANNN